MENIGAPRFFASHSATVRAVAFNPVERYLFASGGNDGNICMYHAGRAELLNIYTVINSGLNRHINAIRHTCDGKKILSVTTSRRLSVLDVERGLLVNSYENCAFSGRDRAALAVDPQCPHMAVCSYVNGKGLTMFDLRMPLPLDFVFDFHTEPIRDIQYLDSTWPFAKAGGGQSIMTLSSAGVAKICGTDGTVLHAFDFGQCANSIVATPEPFGSAANDGFTSALLAGGTLISSYAPTPQSIAAVGSTSIVEPITDELSVRENEPAFGVRNFGERNGHRSYNNIIRRSSSGSSLMDHDGEGVDGQPPPVRPPLQSRRSEIIFSPEGIRIRSLAAAGSLSSASGSGVNLISNGQPRYLPRPTYPQDTSSSAAIRQHILNHIQNHGQQNQANGNASSSSSSADSQRSHAVTPLRPNLQQFLAMNLIPLRSSVVQAVIQPPPVSTAAASQIVFHDPWDQNRNTSLTTDEAGSPGAQQVVIEGTPGNLVYFVDGVYTTKPPGTLAGLGNPQFIWRLKYSKSGAFLYATGDGGSVRRYRQCPGQELKSLGDLFKHRGDVVDMDISPYDEYIVTASKDKTVGLLCLGSPNHGWTEYYELS